MKMPHMDVIFYPVSFIMVSFWLRKLVLMMRENEVNSTWVNIEFLTKNRARHSRALNVPTRSSLSPRRIPLWFVRLRSFPQCKILFILFLSFLVIFLFFSLCLFHSFKFTIFKFFSKSLNIEINWSIWCIGITIGDDFLNKGHNLRDILCNSGDIVGNLYSEFAA